MINPLKIFPHVLGSFEEKKIVSTAPKIQLIICASLVSQYSTLSSLVGLVLSPVMWPHNILPFKIKFKLIGPGIVIFLGKLNQINV